MTATFQQSFLYMETPFELDKLDKPQCSSPCLIPGRLVQSKKIKLKHSSSTKTCRKCLSIRGGGKGRNQSAKGSGKMAKHRGGLGPGQGMAHRVLALMGQRGNYWENDVRVSSGNWLGRVNK